MSKFWSDIVKKLDPYVPGEQPKVDNLVKLNTNENPYGPSPKAIKAMQEQATDTLRLYPDPNADLLKEAVANYYKVEPAKVFLGNGSDEVLAHTFHGLLQQKKPLLFADITYSFYPVYCGLYGVESTQIPLRENFELVVDDYMQENGGILIANPNAPTGRYVGLADIERLVMAQPDSLVVVDEAYIDFGGESAVSLVGKYDNLLVIQTLSKSRSLAGLRVGFAIGNEDLIDALERVKNSFNSYPLDRFAIFGGKASMDDVDYFEKTRKKIITTREWLYNSLVERGFDVIPSSANFVFARNPSWDGGELSDALRKYNILVRHFKKERIDQYLRITVGTESECRRLIEVLDELLGR